MLAALDPLKIFAPLIADDAGFDAHLRPVRLNHLSHPARVGIIGALHWHRPERDFGTGFDARLLQQRFGLLRIVGVIFQLPIRAPDARRQNVFRYRAGAFEDCVDNRLFIDGHCQRLAHLHIIQRRFGGVKREKTGVQARLLLQRQIGIVAHLIEIGRIRERHNLALIFLQLRQSHRGVRRD